jgi:hypothetical protein
MKLSMASTPKFSRAALGLLAGVALLLSGCPSKEGSNAAAETTAAQPTAWLDFENKPLGIAFKYPNIWEAAVEERRSPRSDTPQSFVSFSRKGVSGAEKHVMDMRVANRTEYTGDLEAVFSQLYRRQFTAADGMKKIVTKGGYPAVVWQNGDKPADSVHALVDCGSKILIIDSESARCGTHLEGVLAELRGL